MCKSIKIQLPKEVETILMKLNNYGYQGCIVGGCVRDSLLNRKPKDWDICTSALPEDVKKVFSDFKIVEKGIKHGTVTVLINQKGFEITTFRKDGGYSDSRHPDNVEFISELKIDLSRRDFTINAMAYNHLVGIIDPFRGIDDLHNKLIRCVGDAQVKFTEDPLRILRMLRFQAQLQFTVEPKTLTSSFVNKNLLLTVSKERVQSELCKFLYGKDGNVISVIEVLCISDMSRSIFFQILPNMKATFRFFQNNSYHRFDVFGHTMCALSQVSKSDDIIIRLAILFHDIGKPCCYSRDENGTGHFYGHSKIGAVITDELMRELKFDNNTRRKVVELVFLS